MEVEQGEGSMGGGVKKGGVFPVGFLELEEVGK